MKKTSHQKSIIAGNMTTTKGRYYLRSHARAEKAKYSRMMSAVRKANKWYYKARKLGGPLVKRPPPVKIVIEYPTEYTYWQTPKTYYEI